MQMPKPTLILLQVKVKTIVTIIVWTTRKLATDIKQKKMRLIIITAKNKLI